MSLTSGRALEHVMSRAGVILDRDGTLIDVVRDEETGVVGVAFHPDQLRLLPGVVEGLRAFVAAGIPLAIATNQPGPAKGQYSRRAVETTNAALLAALATAGIDIAAIEVCMHHPTGGPGGDPLLVGPCSCRKPAPGMLVRIAARLDLDPARSWMIGDARADVEAARAAGMAAGLVFDVSRCEICPLRAGPSGLAPDATAPRLDELAPVVLAAIAGRSG